MILTLSIFLIDLFLLMDLLKISTLDWTVLKYLNYLNGRIYQGFKKCICSNNYFFVWVNSFYTKNSLMFEKRWKLLDIQRRVDFCAIVKAFLLDIFESKTFWLKLPIRRRQKVRKFKNYWENEYFAKQINIAVNNT